VEEIYIRYDRKLGGGLVFTLGKDEQHINDVAF